MNKKTRVWETHLKVDGPPNDEVQKCMGKLEESITEELNVLKYLDL